MINRREFLAAGITTSTVLPTMSNLFAETKSKPSIRPGRFRLNFAPHFGMFRCSGGDDPTDQIRFMTENGFSVLEDLDLKRRDPLIQNQILKAIGRHGMRMGLFIGSAEFGLPTFASGRADLRARTLRDIRESVDVAKRMNARWFSVVPGKADSRLPKRVQTAHALETLMRAAEICEQAEVVMLLEPLQPGTESPEMFLQTLSQSAILCRLVNSPACKVLFDVYEQAFHFENLLAAIDRYWDVIGYFQIGDDPGRKEPGTGNIDYQNILGHLSHKGYTGIVGMDHGNSLPGERGEQAVITAYLEHDRLSIRNTFASDSRLNNRDVV
jgi:hydroxypyruvate isomerase